METLEFSLSESLKKWLHMADWDLLKYGVFVEAFVSKVPQPLTSGCFIPSHADDLLACCVMWHFVTKMDSYIPLGFSGFLPEILTAFCQFMVPTSHFSTVTERQETFNCWVWFSLSSHFLYCTPCESLCLTGQAWQECNISFVGLVSDEAQSLHLSKPVSLNNNYLGSEMTLHCFCSDNAGFHFN